jgi:uncharacterized cupredoxin-like copper-binding protein
MNRRSTALAALWLVALATAGCGGDSEPADVGAAGDKANASRTIEIRQLDAFRFEPAAIQVKPGETVTIRVTNAGSQIHEFFLGDEKAHDERDAEMKDMGSEPMMMRDMANGVTVDPGASKELTWTFPAKGSVEFGCHEPGHHDKGMKGTFTVAA